MFFEDLRKKWDIILILACNYAVGKVGTEVAKKTKKRIRKN